MLFVHFYQEQRIFTFDKAGTIDYLLVAGGGGGGQNALSFPGAVVLEVLLPATSLSVSCWRSFPSCSGRWWRVMAVAGYATTGGQYYSFSTSNSNWRWWWGSGPRRNPASGGSGGGGHGYATTPGGAGTAGQGNNWWSGTIAWCWQVVAEAQEQLVLMQFPQMVVMVVLDYQIL